MPEIAKKPKVLVGCPTYKGKDYCLLKYAKAVLSLNYDNYNILLVDNSKTGDYIEDIKKTGIPVLKDVHNENHKESIVHSRNLLRKKALEQGYDYLLSLEQDVIPPKDIIEKLLAHNKKIISAVYFTIYKFKGVQKLRPLIWGEVPGEKDKMQFLNLEVKEAMKSKQPSLKKILMCGLGCVLIHRDVLEKIEFRNHPEYKTYDDFQFCQDSREKGFDIFADLSVSCNHLIQVNPNLINKSSKKM